MRSLTTLVSLAVAVCAAPFASGAALDKRADGFVGVSGQSFTLNGETFVVAGTNAYWLAQNADADIDTAFDDIANAGLTTVRTWYAGLLLSVKCSSGAPKGGSTT